MLAISKIVTYILINLTILLIVNSSYGREGSLITAVVAQRSLLHWKQELQYQLNTYAKQLNIMGRILDDSIYPRQRKTVDGRLHVQSGSSVQFSDLIIPTGALVMEPPHGASTFKTVTQKTDDYVQYKMTNLLDVRNHLTTIKRDLDNPNHRYIYKGVPKSQDEQNFAAHNYFNSSVIPGNWYFKQVSFANVIDASEVNLKRINHTEVNRVISDTYMDHPSMSLRDSQSRLYFEGKKTFYRTIFQRQLKSGCCDRLKPIHTSRMMTRSGKQDVNSPIMFVTDPYLTHQVAVAIRSLKADYLYNRELNFGIVPTQTLDPTGLLPSPPRNTIQLNNLISIKQPNQPEIYKTLVFNNIVLIHDADLAFSFENKLAIGYVSNSGFRNFELDHDNYLLKFSHSRNNISTMQQVAGRIVVNTDSHFLSGLDGQSVNMVNNFNSFVLSNVVRTDRPMTINGPIQIDALPLLFSSPQNHRSNNIQRVPIVSVKGDMHVGLLNGMRIPQDLILMQPHPGGLRSHEIIKIRGSRNFANGLVVRDFLKVQNRINGMRMPQDVIPLHLYESMESVGYTNLAFVDGIYAMLMTIQNGQLDEINLRNGEGSAQDLIMNSVFVQQPDGSQLIRGPLRIQNLRVIGDKPSSGLVNGFRPDRLPEFGYQLIEHETLSGAKIFNAPVEVDECIFRNINGLNDWVSHMIRIDRPDTLQVIHKRLSFVQPPGTYSSLSINRLSVDFLPHHDSASYKSNTDFSPEFYILNQSLQKALQRNNEGRYRVLERVQLLNGGFINNISLNDIITLDAPFRFSEKFTLVGKVEVLDNLKAGRIRSNYPIDVMDLVQFDKYRIPIAGPWAGPIKLNNLILSGTNHAASVHTPMLNGIAFSQFARSIMSLTRPQVVDDILLFNGPVEFRAQVRTERSFNNIDNFRQFANALKTAKYSFENGLQCNSVLIRT